MINPIENWLTRKGATPTERKLYKIAVRLCAKRPVIENRDLRTLYPSHRTNLTQHLSSMVKKGLLIKHSRQWYTPAEITAKKPRR